MTLSMIDSKHKTDGNCIFVRNTYDIDHVYRVTEDVTYDGTETTF